MSAALAPRWRLGRTLLALLREWKSRELERRELARLSERELRDFSISRSEAYAEMRKPFWRG
jgi:uncharacterized protein YjiS (DUF1127 family)